MVHEITVFTELRRYILPSRSRSRSSHLHHACAHLLSSTKPQNKHSGLLGQTGWWPWLRSKSKLSIPLLSRGQEPRPSVGFLLPFAHGETLNLEPVVLCSVSAAQALAGLRLPKGKRDPKSRQSHVPPKSWRGMLVPGHSQHVWCGLQAQGLGWGMGGQAMGRTTVWEGDGGHPTSSGRSGRQELWRQNSSMGGGPQGITCWAETKCVHGYHFQGGYKRGRNENQALPPAQGCLPSTFQVPVILSSWVPVSPSCILWVWQCLL